MFSLASSAAQQAMLHAKTYSKPIQSPPKVKREKYEYSRRMKHPYVSRQPPGVKPILKRDETSTSSSATAFSVSSQIESDTKGDFSQRTSDLSISEIGSTTDRGRVTFVDINIREFRVELGDCPYSEGAPLCITNDLQAEYTVCIDKYEEMKSKRRSTTKGRSHSFRLSPHERSNILLLHGYSMSDIVEAAVSNDLARRELMLSLQNKKWDSFNAIREAASRRLRKLVLGEESSPTKIPEDPVRRLNRAYSF